MKTILRGNASDATSDVMTISLTELCNSDLHRNIRFRVVDTMNHARVFDEVVFSVEEMEKKKRFEAATGASLILLKANIIERFSLVDYLRSGVQISLVGAVDYTASNGNPTDSSSLHFLGAQNQYE